jgi:hypothetical protein
VQSTPEPGARRKPPRPTFSILDRY